MSVARFACGRHGGAQQKSKSLDGFNPAYLEPQLSSIRILVICVFRRGRSILVARGVDEVKREAFLRPVGGAVEFGESSLEALRREVREELGAEIIDPVRLGVLENRFTYSGQPGHEIVFVYDAGFEDPDLHARPELPLNEPIWDGAARWIDLDSLPAEPLYPDGLLQLLRAAV